MAKIELTCAKCGSAFLREIGEHNRNVRKGASGPFCQRRCIPRKPPPAPFDFSAFWSRVSGQGAADGCWEWVGARNRDGYGTVKFAGRTASTHRVSWIYWNRELPAGMAVLHRCDNPPCVNPRHLFLGDQGVNARDREAKGRGRYSRSRAA